MVEDKLRRRFDYYLGKTEIVIYSVLAVLLAVTAFVTIATAVQILWVGLSHWTVAAQTLRVLNQLLIVLMLVEILHTVRIVCSLRRKTPNQLRKRPQKKGEKLHHD